MVYVVNNFFSCKIHFISASELSSNSAKIADIKTKEN